MLNIKIDSRRVTPGDTFIAMIGEQCDGHDFIEEAIKNGATKIISTKLVPCSVEIEVVEDTKKYLQEYLKNTYSEEIAELTIIGITGTNGKTTTTYLLYQMLMALGVPTACIGTLGYMAITKTKPLNNTTPDIITLYELLLQAKKEGIKVIVMEVSSHALTQQRLYGITLDYGGFTNLTLDHLDYHKTMEAYLQAKVKITKMLKKTGKMVINSDDSYHHHFAKKPYITIGKQAKDYQIVRYMYNYPSSHLTMYHHKEYQLALPFLGEFNMYNYLMAVAIVHDIGHSLDEIFEISPTLQVPDGRCAIFSLPKGKAIIDYAHTPDAVLNIITAMQKEAKGKIITIIGCGGNRDSSKRGLIGEIVTKHSDLVVFTNDNPRHEEPIAIIDQMVAGAQNNNYVIIQERKQAIQNSIKIMQENDTLLVLGKGHETYQIIGDKKIGYSDIEEVKKYSIKRKIY